MSMIVLIETKYLGQEAVAALTVSVTDTVVAMIVAAMVDALTAITAAVSTAAIHENAAHGQAIPLKDRLNRANCIVI